MKLATNRLIFVAFFVLPIISADRKPGDLIIDGTEEFRDALPEIRDGIVKYQIEALTLPTISNEHGDNDGEVLENGLLFGAKNIDIGGNWTVDYYSKEQVAYVVGSFETDLIGNFSYTDKSNPKMQKCQLDVEMENAKIEVNGWYIRRAKRIYLQTVKVYSIDETKMFVDKCGPEYQRKRLSKSLEDNYKPKILEVSERKTEQLIGKAASNSDVSNQYLDFLENLRLKHASKVGSEQ